MKSLITALSILFFFNGYAQNDDKYPPPSEERKQKCVSLENKTELKHGLIYAHWLDDTLKQSLDTFLYNEIDSIRVAYKPNSLLLPLFENGIINGKDLALSGMVGFEEYATMFIDHGLDREFLNAEKEKDNWNGKTILIVEIPLERYNTYNTKAFKFGMPSKTGSTISIYYLELKNSNADSNTSTFDFIKGAHVSCLLKWYAII